ncbi:MAG: NAD(P)-dependent oxidoreductase [Candidatus Hydrogenedentes bacterium]|nr:NAD(P)-dependent oxidoreductase [Candidatus Hydrogenedentota bacterium]
MKLGLVGLGLLGSAVAERLHAAGCIVHGYDVRPEAVLAAAALGIHAHENAVAVQAPLVILNLLTSGDRRTLLWGDQAFAQALLPGTVVLDTSTGDPAHLVEDHQRLHEQGVRLIDACVAGSSDEVRKQEALLLVGATAQEMAPFAPILEAISRRQFYFESPGQGCRAKLIFNTVLGLHRLVLAEALGLARKSGFDLAEMLSLLQAGAAHSAVMDTKGVRMVTEHYAPPVARLSQHAKDVDLILAFAESVGADVPVSRLHRDLLTEALALGAGELDNAAIFTRYPR